MIFDFGFATPALAGGARVVDYSKYADDAFVDNRDRAEPEVC